MSLRIIAGFLRGRRIRTLPGKKLRPTSDPVREALFNILGPQVAGRRVFDLFAGTGALGLEALSRGAAHAVFVEQNVQAVALIRENLRMLGLESQATVFQADVLRWANRYSDWAQEPEAVLIDPPYGLSQAAWRDVARLLSTLEERLPPGSVLVLQSGRHAGTAPLPHPEKWDVRQYGKTQLAIRTVGDSESSGPVAGKSCGERAADPAAAGRTGDSANQTDDSPPADTVDLNLADPKQRFAYEVAERLRDAGYDALWAGGCVRDLLLKLDVPPEDYDVATNARPEEVRGIFGHAKTVAVGASFGVILVLGPPEAGNVEVATFRTEGPYTDGRRPDRVVYSTAEADAQRRDFTINGMFFDPFRRKVLDYVGGRDDLRRGVIRAIGDPDRRFAEDKLRLLRAVRFSASLEFPLDKRTEESVRKLAPEVRTVSPERTAEELRRMLVHRNRARAMELAWEMGLIEPILPELLPLAELPADEAAQPATEAAHPTADLWDHTLVVLAALEGPSFPLALAALLHEVGKPEAQARAVAGESISDYEEQSALVADRICRRLRLSNTERHRVDWLVALHRYLLEAERLPPAKLKRILVEPGIDELLELHRADALATGDSVGHVEYCCGLLREMPEEELNPPPLLSGHDLLAHGVPQGPVFHILLDKVRDAQLNGEIESNREALALVDRLLAEGIAEEAAK